jgi:hypothetical protein
LPWGWSPIFFFPWPFTQFYLHPLILRKLLGAGTPRELKDHVGQVFLRLLCILLELAKAVSPSRRLLTMLASREHHHHIAALIVVARDF